MSIFFRIGRSPPPATETGSCATTIQSRRNRKEQVGHLPHPPIFGRSVTPFLIQGGRFRQPHHYVPPSGFSDPPTALHITALLILPYNHRHNRKIMRRVAVGRASASKELCCASRSIRFACNDHLRGHSKTILIGFLPFLTNYLLIYTLIFSKMVIP